MKLPSLAAVSMGEAISLLSRSVVIKEHISVNNSPLIVYHFIALQQSPSLDPLQAARAPYFRNDKVFRGVQWQLLSPVAPSAWTVNQVSQTEAVTYSKGHAPSPQTDTG